ncbi:uncharacterized protein LOC129592750 [Paramacrobiotus metropolitanus]|uniref:uncharacterized protein LOC129592750 n=1 Tax=Paramacrobiotus metropolitanus TaxID=2943436 RepID=UPI0024460D91|nr:uncharacterized protein LOC129592750 [Paramacrobiotus metropolitanus]
MNPAQQPTFHSGGNFDWEACVRAAARILDPPSDNSASKTQRKKKKAINPKTVSSLLRTLQDDQTVVFQHDANEPSLPMISASTPKTRANGAVYTQPHARDHYPYLAPYQVPQQPAQQEVSQRPPLQMQHTGDQVSWTMSTHNSAADTPAIYQNGQAMHRLGYTSDIVANYGVPVSTSSVSNSAVDSPANWTLNHRSASYNGECMGLVLAQNRAYQSQAAVVRPPQTITPSIPALSPFAGSTESGSTRTVSITLSDWPRCFSFEFNCVFCLETLPTLQPARISAGDFRQHLKTSRYCYGRNLQFLRAMFDKGAEETDEPLANGQVKRQLVCLLCKAARQTSRYRLPTLDVVAHHMQRYHAVPTGQKYSVVRTTAGPFREADRS